MSNFDVKEVAEQIAPALGPGWTVDYVADDYRNRLSIVHTDGRTLNLRRPWNKQGMIEFTPDYYSNSKNERCTLRDDHNSICCTADRPPHAIAADIKRRLLSWYTQRYTERKAEALRKETSHDKKNSQAWEIAARMGTDVTTEHYYARGHPTAVNELGFIAMQYNHIEVRLTLNHDEALLLADVLRSLQQMRDARKTDSPPIT